MAEKSDLLSDVVDSHVTLKGVLVRNLTKVRTYEVPYDLLTTDFNDVLNNPEVDVVVELLGGHNPALDYILKSISLGKHVVTANKRGDGAPRA